MRNIAVAMRYLGRAEGQPIHHLCIGRPRFQVVAEVVETWITTHCNGHHRLFRTLGIRIKRFTSCRMLASPSNPTTLCGQWGTEEFNNGTVLPENPPFPRSVFFLISR